MSSKLEKYFKGDELAPTVWKSKYATAGEEIPDDMHRRLAKEFAKIETINRVVRGSKKWNDSVSKLSEYGSSFESLSEEHIYNLFKDFRYVVPQGSIMATLGTDVVASLSNCFVLGAPQDSYGGIFQKDEEMVQLMKRRGGVGIDISTLRPKDTSVSNAAKTTTGAVSFMHRFSNSTKEVAQNGRRGALMLSVDINHPDVMDFIKIKRDNTSVTGANISIKINNEFMKAVENDEDYLLRFPCNKILDLPNNWADLNLEYNKIEEYIFEDNDVIYLKKIRAKEYWEEIIKSAHGYAEPGIIFVDNHHNYSPDGVYEQYKGITTNPSLRHNTLIQTDLGLFPIKELAEKDGLTIVKNVLNEWQVGKVFMSGKDKDLYKITFTNGYEVFCTAEHKWVVLNSAKNIFNKNSGKVIKKRTDELMFGHPKLGGDRIPLPFKPEYEGNVSCKYTVDDGFILGYWLGDGWSTMTERGVYQHSFIVSEKELECCGNRIKKIFNKNSTSKSTFNQDHDSKAYILNSSSEDFRTYFEQFIDTNDKSKGIPNKVFKFGKEALKGFIDGLFSSDGSVWANEDLVHSRITLTTSREMIAKDVQKILNLFGISSRICFSDKNGFNRFDLVISGIQTRKFGQTFNLTSKYKQESLNEILSFENTYKDNREYLVIKSVENTGIKEDVYDITVHDDTHTFMGEFGVTGNCGEIFMQEYDACRLIAVNLFSFVDKPFTKEAKFNFNKFYEVNYDSMRLSDDLIDLELEHIDRILTKIQSDTETQEVKERELKLWNKVKQTAQYSRRTGLGFTALADTLAALGLKYDSDEGLEVIEQIMKTKMESELDCTIDLAILRGTFEGWNSESEFTNQPDIVGINDFYDFILYNFPTQFKRMMKYGRRNVSWSTVAPTGSVSILTQTTSGLEPLFQPFYMRRKKINPGEDGVRVDFVDEVGDSWQEFPVLHQKFKEWIWITYDEPFRKIDLYSKEELQTAFEQSPWYGSTAEDIDWVKRVEIQGNIQKYISHSISSTVNLPSDVTEEEVAEIYSEAWKKGLKGVTVYRDGSRSGVLISESDNKKLVTFNENHAPKRPKSLTCKVVRFNNNYEKWVAFVGLMDNKPYEVFTGKLENVDLPNGVDFGEILKNRNEDGKKRYDFVFEGGLIEGISNVSSSEYWNYGKLFSGMLRHGMPLVYVVDTINSLNWGSDHINTWKAGIVRALKKFIKDGKAVGFKCNDCSSEQVIFEEGCLRCLDCGSSACG